MLWLLRVGWVEWDSVRWKILYGRMRFWKELGKVGFGEENKKKMRLDVMNRLSGC